MGFREGGTLNLGLEKTSVSGGQGKNFSSSPETHIDMRQPCGPPSGSCSRVYENELGKQNGKCNGQDPEVCSLSFNKQASLVAQTVKHLPAMQET